jgi:hypothetical protein
MAEQLQAWAAQTPRQLVKVLYVQAGKAEGYGFGAFNSGVAFVGSLHVSPGGTDLARQVDLGTLFITSPSSQQQISFNIYPTLSLPSEDCDTFICRLIQLRSSGGGRTKFQVER